MVYKIYDDYSQKKKKIKQIAQEGQLSFAT